MTPFVAPPVPALHWYAAPTAQSEDGQRLARQLEGHLRPSAPPYSPTSRDVATLAEIGRLISESGEADWDGHGAAPVSHQALGHAVAFLQQLPWYIPLPEFSADPDGEVGLDWDFGPDRILSVSIGEGGRVAWAGRDGADRTTGSTRVIGEVPNVLAEWAGRVSDPAYRVASA